MVDGQLRDGSGGLFAFEVLLRQGDGDSQSIMDIYTRALERLGMNLTVSTVDDAQYTARIAAQDFDMTTFRRDLSLSPGNEQKLYWGSEVAHEPGTRNLMGVSSEAIDAMIDTMLSATSEADFVAAARALDRILTAGRFVIPIWQFDVGRIAHANTLHFSPDTPIYGDRTGFLPEVWWFEEN